MSTFTVVDMTRAGLRRNIRERDPELFRAILGTAHSGQAIAVDIPEGTRYPHNLIDPRLFRQAGVRLRRRVSPDGRQLYLWVEALDRSDNSGTFRG